MDANCALFPLSRMWSFELAVEKRCFCDSHLALNNKMRGLIQQVIRAATEQTARAAVQVLAEYCLLNSNDFNIILRARHVVRVVQDLIWKYGCLLVVQRRCQSNMDFPFYRAFGHFPCHPISHAIA